VHRCGKAPSSKRKESCPEGFYSATATAWISIVISGPREAADGVLGARGKALMK
jgi:hypothetical protein